MQPSRGSLTRGRPYTRTPTRGASGRGNERWTPGKSQDGQTPTSPAVRGAFRSRDKRGRGATSSRGNLSKHPSSTAVGAPPSSAIRGQRGRDTFSKAFNNVIRSSIQSPSQSQSRDTSPDYIAPIDLEKIAERRERLKVSYDAERKRCIQQGLIADPSKRTTLENAITPVGRCTDMCDEKERVDRIFEMNGDPAEQLPNSVDGKSTIIESRMVKKFRRAAAGVEEQMPLEIRTPSTLKRTLDYLLDEIFAKHRLAEHHKFIWDRTRAIRNDFSIQQVTKEEDVKLAVDCFERIARFHILSLHQLSNADNLEEDEHFEAHQEREQLNNTLLSLMYYYDDHRDRIDFPNEAEFKAYSILFEIRSPTPDLENRVQSWPRHILCDRRVQTALQLYMAAGDPYHKSGPLRPDTEAVVSQAKSGRVWDLLRSSRVSYLMACVAEINFATVRFTALKCLCEAYYNAPKANFAKITTWTKSRMLEYLAFDTEDEVEEFCADFEMHFVSSPAAGTEDYLDFTAAENMRSYRIPPKQRQVFSHSIVETKRFHRTLTAVINGVSVADALRQNLVVEAEVQSNEPTVPTARSSLFVHDDDEDDENAQEDDVEPTAGLQQQRPPPKPAFNPMAASFTPFSTSPASAQAQSTVEEPRWKTNFGGGVSSTTDVPKGIFGQQNKQKQQQEQPSVSASSSAFTNPFNTPPKTPSKPFNTPSDSFTTTPALNIEQPKSHIESIFKPVAALQTVQNSTSPFSNPTTPATPSFATPDKEPISSTDTAHVQPFPPPTTVSQPLAAQQPSSFPSPFAQTNLKDLPPIASDNSSEQPAKPEFSFSSCFPTGAKPATTTQPSTTSGAVIFPPSVSTGQTDSQIGIAPVTTDTAANPSPAPKELFSQPPGLQVTKPQLIPSNTFQPPSASLAKAPASAAGSQPNLSAAQLLNASQSKQLEENRQELITNMVRIGLTQKDGILDMFLSIKISAIVQDVYRSYTNARDEAKLAHLRKQILSRKFFLLWKDIAQQRRTQRRVERRRKMMAASAGAKRAKEEELEKILEASREAKRVQQEFRQKQEEKRRQAREMQAQQPTQQNAGNGIRHRLPLQVAGQKRKTVASTNSTSNSTSTSAHKRSRTIEHADIDLSTISKRLSSPLRDVKESSSGNQLRKSISHRDLRRSLSRQPLDNTQTDYFLLKAMGISPDTPLIPDTTKTLANRHLDSLTRRHTALKRLERRRLARSGSSQGPFSETSSQPDLLSPTSPESPSSIFKASITPAPDFDPNEDPFLRQFREARQKMEGDREWFKSQASLLEKEIEEQEDFQKSLRESQSLADTENFTAAQAHTNGFAMSANGLAYTPLDYTTGKTLSRTEQRIRRTGAHGLAVKQPVPSNHSSPLHVTEHYPANRQASTPRKRSIDETQPVDAELDPNWRMTAVKRPRKELPHDVVNDFTAPEEVLRHPFPSGEQNFEDEPAELLVDGGDDHQQQHHRPDVSYPERAAFKLPNGLPEELEVYEGDEEEAQIQGGDGEDYDGESEVGDDEAEGEGEYDYKRELDGEEDDDDAEDELEDDEDDEEEIEYEGEEDEEEDEEDFPYKYPQGSLPPSTKLSTGTPESGPGATVDDAIELSD